MSYKCNLRCKTCFIWKKEQKDELSINEIERFFKKSYSFSWIDLTGGEIFLREDLLEIFKIIFRYCQQLCILHFPTNGYLTEKIISSVKEICRYKGNVVLVITVSMDGPEEINNEIRGNENAWIRSLETFIELKKIGLKFVYLGYTISKYNSGKLKDMLYELKNYYPQISYDDLHINIAHTSRHYFNNASEHFNLDEIPAKDIVDVIRVRKIGIKNFLEQHYLRAVPNYLSSKQAPLRCKVLSSSCFVDPYGDIYPCIIYDKKLSNIHDINYDLFKFWNEDDVKILREEILDKKCQGCWTPCEAYPAILGSIF